MTLVSKAFSDIVTFSRSSNATRIGPNGLVQYAPHNLLQRSQEFDNAYWTKTNATVTANSIAAPDGTVTADTHVSTVSGGSLSNLSVNVGTLTNGQTYTVSRYVKAGSKAFCTIGLFGLADAYFDLNNTTYSFGGTGAVSASIADVGNGWKRITATWTWGAGTTYTLFFGMASSLSSQTGLSVGDYIYTWGAQLAVGPLALDYTPTTTAALYGPRFDYDGSGVTSVDPIARNLLTYSEQFDNAAWIKSSTTVTANAAAAPDGTVTADLVTWSGSSEIAQISAVTNGTLSFWAKGVAGQTLFVGIAGTSTTTTITLSDSWQRYSLSFTGTSTYIYLGKYSGATVTSAYLWGAQLEIGNTATGYMVSGATNGFRAVPVVTGNATARGLLIEEQRTNIVTYSDQFDNAAWTKSGASITANAIASPDGTVTADQLVEAATTAEHRISQSGSALSVSTAYTISVYAKAAGRNQIQIRLRDTSDFAKAIFNLSTGSVDVTYNGTASITSVGNGWYRCVVTGTSPASTSGFIYYIQPAIYPSADPPVYTGDGTSGIYLWGAQLEAGSFATSYIPTLASTVTRSADNASVDTVSPWINLTEGTLYAEWQSISASVAANSGVDLYSASGSDKVSIRNTQMLSNVGGVSQFGFSIGATSASVAKRAVAFKTNDSQAAYNGTASSVDTSCSVSSAIDRINFRVDSATFYPNAYLRRIAFYPRRLSEAELQALTA